MPQTPDAVMLFAAGFGTRMRHLTANRPKPLVRVAGKALLDHALDLVDGARIGRKVVNLHYHGDQIVSHLSHRKDIGFSWERDAILETGGGLRAALPQLGQGPVFTLNTDAVWTGQNPLNLLRETWDPARMEALLLLAPPQNLRGHSGKADFTMDADGRIQRAAGRDGFVYLGAQIIDPSGLSEFPEAAFSLNLLWDRLIAKGRAFGVVHQGGWCDVGSPEGIAEAEAMLENPDV